MGKVSKIDEDKLKSSLDKLVQGFATTINKIIEEHIVEEWQKRTKEVEVEANCEGE